MQPLLPMSMSDQWFATPSTCPAREMPRRPATARITELRSRVAPAIRITRPAPVAGG